MDRRIVGVVAVVCLGFLLQGRAWAGFKMPSAVFELSELEAAQAKARASGKPIAVIYTDHTSDCGLCASASKVILDELDSQTVMVCMPTGLKKWPDFLKAAFKRGKYIPKVAVFDVELKELLGEVVYEEIKQDGDDAFDDLLDAIKTYRKTQAK